MTRVNSAVDFSDTEKAFQHVKLLELARNAAIFKMCSYSTLVALSTRFQQGNSRTSKLLKPAFKRFIMPVFSPGEELGDCINLTNKLYVTDGVTAILDFSSEELELEEMLDKNMENKVAMIEGIHRLFPQKNVRSIPLKCTSLINPFLLERITEAINRRQQQGLMPSDNTDDILRDLSDAEREKFQTAIARFCTICDKAVDAGISILLDAEQSNRQPAIEVLARILSRRYNTPGRGAVIYNTYQAYLTRTPHAYDRDLAIAAKEGFVFAAKVVRGAYMNAEKERAAVLKVPSPIVASKRATDEAYNRMVESTLKAIGDPQRGTKPSIIIATHNRKSIEEAILAMADLNIAPNSGEVQFAQILGMSDNITYTLAHNGELKQTYVRTHSHTCTYIRTYTH
jgi:proline dehydrogenase